MKKIYTKIGCCIGSVLIALSLIAPIAQASQTSIAGSTLTLAPVSLTPYTIVTTTGPATSTTTISTSATSTTAASTPAPAPTVSTFSNASGAAISYASPAGGTDTTGGTAAACPAVIKTDNTPCGLISQVCASQGNLPLLGSSSQPGLLYMFFGDLTGVFSYVPFLGSWLDNAIIYDFSTTSGVTQSCSAAGYFMTAQGGGTGAGSGFQGFTPGRTITAMEGFAHVAGQEVEVKVRFDATTLNANAFGMGADMNVSILVGMPVINQHINFSAISPLLSVFNDLEIENAAFAWAGADYFDEEWNTEIQRGFTILCTIGLTGSIASFLKSITGYSGATIVMKCFLTTSIIGSYFSIELDQKLSLGPLGSTNTALTLTFYLQQALPGAPLPTLAVGISAGFTVTFPGCSTPVMFSGEFRINPETTDILLTLWMEGFIQFDKIPPLKPFQIGNIVLAVSLNANEAADSGGLLAFTGCFWGGTLAVGSVEFLLYCGMDVSASEPEFIIDIELDGKISLKDIVGLGCDAMRLIKINVPASVINGTPDIAIKDLKGYMCTETAVYAGRVYQEGMEVLAEIELFGVTLGLDISLVPSTGKITAACWMSRWNWGPLYVTGRGMDMKWNTADDGPVVRFEIDVTQEPFVSFFVSGLVDVRVQNVNLVRAMVDFFIAPIGFCCEIDCALFGIFEANCVVNMMYVPQKYMPFNSETSAAANSIATSAAATVAPVATAASEAGASVASASTGALSSALTAAGVTSAVADAGASTAASAGTVLTDAVTAGVATSTLSAAQSVLTSATETYNDLAEEYGVTAANKDDMLAAHPDLAAANTALNSAQAAVTAAQAAQSSAVATAVVSSGSLASDVATYQAQYNALALKYGVTADNLDAMLQAHPDLQNVYNSLTSAQQRLTAAQTNAGVAPAAAQAVPAQ